MTGLLVFRFFKEELPETAYLSLMSQYTPEFCDSEKYPELGRRLTGFEYDSVSRLAQKLGFDGYFQAHSSANKKYTPDF